MVTKNVSSAGLLGHLVGGLAVVTTFRHTHLCSRGLEGSRTTEECSWQMGQWLGEWLWAPARVSRERP